MMESIAEEILSSKEINEGVGRGAGLGPIRILEVNRGNRRDSTGFAVANGAGSERPRRPFVGLPL